MSTPHCPRGSRRWFTTQRSATSTVGCAVGFGFDCRTIRPRGKICAAGTRPRRSSDFSAGGLAAFGAARGAAAGCRRGGQGILRQEWLGWSSGAGLYDVGGRFRNLVDPDIGDPRSPACDAHRSIPRLGPPNTVAQDYSPGKLRRMSSPSPFYQQHHRVEPPRIDATTFRPGWRRRTRLDCCSMRD